MRFQVHPAVERRAPKQSPFVSKLRRGVDSKHHILKIGGMTATLPVTLAPRPAGHLWFSMLIPDSHGSLHHDSGYRDPPPSCLNSSADSKPQLSLNGLFPTHLLRGRAQVFNGPFLPGTQLRWHALSTLQVSPQTHGHTSLGEVHSLFRKYRNVELSALKN